MISPNSSLKLILLSTLSVAAAGCAKPLAGTTVTSQAYNTSVASFRVLDWLLPSAVATTSFVNSVKLCIPEFKLDAPDGSEVADVKEDTSNVDSNETKIGLVDLGDGTKSITWGAAAFPPGTIVKKIKMEIEKDPQLCQGANFSASINGQTITRSLELTFTFANPKTVANFDTVAIALTNLVLKLTAAAQAGQLDDAHIGTYIDGSFEDSIH